jgi:hypothetical protein
MWQERVKHFLHILLYKFKKPTENGSSSSNVQNKNFEVQSHDYLQLHNFHTKLINTG